MKSNETLRADSITADYDGTHCHAIIENDFNSV